MAADRTLVQGAAVSAPQFVDAAGAFEDKFKSTLGEITEATNEANAKRSELISSLDFIQFDENGNTIPMSESQRAIAETIRAGYIDKINSGDPFAPNKAKIIGDAKIEVNKVASLANVHKQVVADLQSAKSELSGANDLSAIEKLNQIKDAKLEKDPKTGEYKYNVGGVLKSAQELAAYPDDVIEVPAVPMKNVNETLAKSTETFKKVDPNDPSKYSFDVKHAKPFIEGKIQEQLNDPAYGNDFRYHTLSSGDSMYIKSNNPIAKLYAGKTKSEIDEIALNALQLGGKLPPNAPQQVKDKMVREFLNTEVKNAYVEGFMQMQPNAKLPTPEPPKEKPTEGAIKRAIDKEDKKIFGESLIENANRISAGGDKGELKQFMTKDGDLRADQIEAYGRAANIPNTIITKAPPIFKTELNENDEEVQVQINPNEFIVANDRTGKQVPFNANQSISPEDIEGFAMTAYGFNAKEIAEYKRRKAAFKKRTAEAKARAEKRRNGLLNQ